MDLLSFSPSLLQIISLLDRTDIAQCRLVNRRFCQTINTNRRISPRKAICLTIKRVIEQNDSEYVLVTAKAFDGRKPRISFRIDNQSIRQLECSDVPLFQYAYNNEKMDGLSINSMVEGVRTVITPLCQNYNLKLLELEDKNPTATELYPMVMEIYKRTHDHLGIFQSSLWPHVRKMIMQSDIFRGLVFPKYYDSCPPNLLKEGIQCCVASIVEIMAGTEEFFKGWYAGLYRIGRIELTKVDEVVIDISPVYYELAAWLGPDCVWESFVRNEAWNDATGECFPSYYAFFRRPSDDVILCILYDTSDGTLYIYDSVHRGPLDQFKFYLCQFYINTFF